MKTELRDIYEIAKDLRGIMDEDKRNDILFYIQSLHQKIENFNKLLNKIIIDIDSHNN